MGAQSRDRAECPLGVVIVVVVVVVVVVVRPLPAGCPDRPRREKAMLFNKVFNKKQYFFSPGRSRPLAPTGPGVKKRYFLIMFQIKRDTFALPAALHLAVSRVAGLDEARTQCF